MEFIATLIITLPLISSIINGILYKKLTDARAGIISSIAIAIASICALCVFVHSGINQNIIHITFYKWFTISELKVHFAMYIDQLTAIMFIVVTLVSSVVHIYSFDYMKGDGNLPKFLSYLSLFTFFMLMLVASDNFMQLFFGWEGVGVCSYLLIGYYSHKDSANNAAIKAFLVNRIADFAFIIGIIMILINTHTLDFATLFHKGSFVIYNGNNHVNFDYPAFASLVQNSVEFWGVKLSLLDITCLLLFIGCMGKSAQIGLHVWLPEAMEGPTPVSALIHAATMVTAGIFLVARCSFLFEYSPIVLQIITIIGSITCIFAASVAIAQSDIKKIIAYSTCSQLGYMFFALGVSAYQAGIFHLVTHGFFKALLFLSAGSVIHACHEQNVFKMGGLRKKMPITYTNFWIGSLAIIGIYPLAGFYSKDMILESALESGSFVGNFAFVLGIIAAILTAIYSLKIIILVFHGKTNLSQITYDAAHEATNIMNIPMILLTAGALFSGMFGFYILNISNPFGYFKGNMLNLHIRDAVHRLPLYLQTLPLIVGIVGAVIGYYSFKTNIYKHIASNFSFIHNILKSKFLFDEIYEICIIKPFKYISLLSRIFDIQIIDRFGARSSAYIVRILSSLACQVQTGYIFNYALYIILALMLCMSFIIFYSVGII